MSVEQDSWDVLGGLLEWEEDDDDPNKGRYSVNGPELAERLGLDHNRISDAVEYLDSFGYVETYRPIGGTAPFSFKHSTPTVQGRAAFNSFQAAAPIQESSEARATASFDVFLSHSALDDDLTADVKSLLEKNDISVFATPESIPTGGWEKQIELALRNSTMIWLLLTPNALSKSVWTHHEFGYFYGFAHGQKRDDGGHMCRYLYVRGTQRPGLYAHIQGTEIQSFENPVEIAKVIADSVEKPFVVPVDWSHRIYPPPVNASERHPDLGKVDIVLGRSGDAADLQIEISEISEPIYHVYALTDHPRVEISEVRPADVISQSAPRSIFIRFVFKKHQSSGSTGKAVDHRGRQFSLLPGPRRPEGKWPLLLTYETEDGRAQAAVFYYDVKTHQKGFPEITLTTTPFEWRDGEMPAPEPVSLANSR